MGFGPSEDEKNEIEADRESQRSVQRNLEAKQAQEEQIESQELLRRRLAALRRVQGGGSGTSGIDTSVTNPDSTLG